MNLFTNVFTNGMSSERISLRDIAAAAGVSLATVSYALRKHPKIPAETRARIEAIAQKRGWRPDPSFAVLGARRWAGRSAYSGLSMAYLAPAQALWTPFQQRCFAGACDEAARLGYRLHHFVPDEFTSPAHLGEVLERRTCSGVILRRIQDQRQIAGFPFDRFAVVACGHGAVDPRCHIVMPHHQHNLAAVWRRMRATGARRIGVVLLEGDVLAELPRFYLGALLQAQLEVPASCRIPPFSSAAFAREPFVAWLRRHRPEAIIGCVDRIWDWLRNARTPAAQVPFASLEKSDPDDRAIAGIDLRPHLMGATAVDQLARAITANERGLPDIRQIILIESPWCAGETLPG